MLVFLGALARLIRRPRAANLDVVLLFGAVAYAVVQQWLFGALGLRPPELLADVSTAFVAAIPYLLLRLVDRFSGVPGVLLYLALAGLVVCIGILFLVPTPLSLGPLLAVVAYFVLVTAYATVGFVRAARSLMGVNGKRMAAVAAGNLALGLAVFIAGVRALIPEASGPGWTDGLQITTSVLALASGAAYYMGFTPPSWLRRLWRDPDLRAFLQRSATAAQQQPDLTGLLRELEVSVAATLGVPNAFVAVWDETTDTLNVVAESSRLPRDLALTVPGVRVQEGMIWSPSGVGLAGRAFRLQQPIFSEQPGRDAPELAEVYQATGTGAMMAAPMSLGGERYGVVGVYASRPALFAEDDLELLAQMAQQAAVIFLSRRLQERIAVLRAHEEANKFKDAFLGSVTHDLKTPLTAIKAVAQWVRRRTELQRSTEPGALESDMGRIEASVDRMTGMVNQLLDISRLQMGRPLDTYKTPTDLVALARAAAAEYARITSRHQIRVDTQLDRLMGNWDASRLERVLSNVLDNAVKYSPDGGEVVVSLTRDGSEPPGWAQVSVRDHGIGIPETELPRIFERFERGSNVEGLGIAGTGIGLAYVIEVVDNHGGRVVAESNQGEGTTITVFLPLDDLDESESAIQGPDSGASA